jgi:hypothetical protein
MENKVRMLMVNYFDLLSEVTVTPAPVATLPASNMQLEDNAKMRVNSNTVTIKFKFDTTYSVNTVYLHDCNLTGLAVASYTLYSDDNYTTQVATGSLFISSTAIEGWQPNFALANLDSFNIQSVKIDITNTAGYFDCGRLFIGNSLSPTVNFSYGWNFTVVDESKQERTEAGVLHSQVKQSYRKISFTLDYLLEDETEAWKNDLLYCGTRKQLLICLFPLGDAEQILNHTVLGKFTEGEFSFTQNNYAERSIPFTIEEGYTVTGENSSVIYLTDQITSLSATITSQQDENDSLTTINGVLQARIDQLEAEIAEYETRVTNLEECCELVKSDIAALEVALSNL